MTVLVLSEIKRLVSFEGRYPSWSSCPRHLNKVSTREVINLAQRSGSADLPLHGAKFGVEIGYVREEKRMGTAGALSLLSPRPTLPIIVMNGDILTSVNFGQLLSFHYDSLALATMGLNRFQYQLPYGVVQVRNHNIASFTEKPAYDFFVNAGIYVVSPEALDYVPVEKYFDMPSLFDQISPDRRVAFPICEYWLDIGRHDDLERASWEFPKSHSAGPNGDR